MYAQSQSVLMEPPAEFEVDTLLKPFVLFQANSEAFAEVAVFLFFTCSLRFYAIRGVKSRRVKAVPLPLIPWAAWIGVDFFWSTQVITPVLKSQTESEHFFPFIADSADMRKWINWEGSDPNPDLHFLRVFHTAPTAT